MSLSHLVETYGPVLLFPTRAHSCAEGWTTTLGGLGATQGRHEELSMAGSVTLPVGASELHIVGARALLISTALSCRHDRHLEFCCQDWTLALRFSARRAAQRVRTRFTGPTCCTGVPFVGHEAVYYTCTIQDSHRANRSWTAPQAPLPLAPFGLDHWGH